MKAFLHTNSWAGHGKTPVEIIKETPKRFRVKLLEDTTLPGRNRSGKAGQEILVPKYAISQPHNNAIQADAETCVCGREYSAMGYCYYCEKFKDAA